MTASSINDTTGATIPPAKVETTTLYLNGFQYLNGALDVFPHAQGLVSVSGTTYTYLYQYKDHLDNIRLTYKDTNGVATITDENHYYPLGMKITESNYVTSALATALKFRYNGQEWQDELGLNMTAMDFRQYDNAIGRFVARDSLAELSYSQPPYHFANNNPINFSDPSGLCPECIEFLEKNGIDPSVGMTFKTSNGENYIYTDTGWEKSELLKNVNVKAYAPTKKKVKKLTPVFDNGGGSPDYFRMPPSDLRIPNFPIEGNFSGIGLPSASGFIIKNDVSIVAPKSIENRFNAKKAMELKEANIENIYTNQFNNPSISLIEFQKEYRGLRENQIIIGNSSKFGYSFPKKINGSGSFVSLKNGEEVDMKHFMVVGRRGHLMGVINEITQIGSNSFFYPQDIYSNRLGVNFFKKYSTLINQHPNDISSYIFQFLSNSDNINLSPINLYWDITPKY